MLGSALLYAARHPARAVHALATDPVAVLETIVDRYVQDREYRAGACRYDVSPGWEAELHHALRADWPCSASLEFRKLWPRVIAKVESEGVVVGPESFNGFNDGDPAFVRAVWCIICHSKPAHVVETGVAHGFTTRIALEALERNGLGHLSSIDRPPLDSRMRQRIGLAVEDRSRWSLILGSSRRRLRPLLAQRKEIGLFVHDSFHTMRNVSFELESAWRHLGAGGAMIIDDLDTNWAFRSFVRSHSVHRSFVCESEPVRPDLRRFNARGLFGIILKGPVWTHP